MPSGMLRDSLKNVRLVSHFFTPPLCHCEQFSYEAISSFYNVKAKVYKNINIAYKHKITTEISEDLRHESLQLMAAAFFLFSGIIKKGNYWFPVSAIIIFYCIW